MWNNKNFYQIIIPKVFKVAILVQVEIHAVMKYCHTKDLSSKEIKTELGGILCVSLPYSVIKTWRILNVSARA